MSNQAKEFFQKIRNIDKQIDAKFEQLEELKALATKVTATMSGESGKPSGASRTMENAVDKIIDLQNELNAEIDRFIDMKREANGILRQIPSEKQRRCLEYRYLLGKTFEAIAFETGYSYFGVCKLHGRALQSAEEIIKKSEKIAES